MALAIILILSSILLLKHPFFNKIDKIPYWWVFAVFILKIGLGCLITIIYTYYYPPTDSDIYKYYTQGMHLSQLAVQDPVLFIKVITGLFQNDPEVFNFVDQLDYWFKPYNDNIYNDSRIIIKLNAILGLISRGNIYTHTIVMCLLSTMGLTALYRFFAYYIKESKKALFAAVFLFPSVLFWGSGMLKEGLFFFAIGYTLYFIHKLINKEAGWKLFLSCIPSILLMFYLKPFAGISLLPPLLALLIGKRFHISPAYRYLFAIALFFIISLLLPYLHPGLNIYQFIFNKQKDFFNLVNAVGAGSIVYIPRISASAWSVIMAAPVALFNVLFRPHIFEAHSIVSLMAALENTVIALLIIVSIVSCLIKKQQIFKNEIFWFALVYVTISFLIIGLTTPVAGAFVRYKTSALPFLGVLFVMAIHKDIFGWVQRKRQKKL